MPKTKYHFCRKIIFVIAFHSLLIAPIALLAQRYASISNFTNYEGLPSNHIYNMVEDKQGFLWVATDNGVARFDGKYFQKFTTNEGLPSNDVLQVMKDGNGTIWANCYIEIPAYFDETLNRFVRVKSLKEVEHIARTYAEFRNERNGDISAISRAGTILLRNKKVLAVYKNKEATFIENGKKYSYSFQPGQKNALITLWDEKGLRDSILLPISTAYQVSLNKMEGYAILREKNKIVKVSVLSASPFKVKINTIQPQNGINSFFIAHNSIIVQNLAGELLFYTADSLSYRTSVKTPGQVTSVYIDSKKNLWVNTLDKGIFYYSLNAATVLQLPQNLHSSNFLSIAVNNNNTLFAGNFSGELLIKAGNTTRVMDISRGEEKFWIRKIVYTNQKTVVISDRYCLLNFHDYNTLKDTAGVNTSIKTIAVVNDSALLMGTIMGVCLFNMNSKKQTWIRGISERIFQIAKFDPQNWYFISASGLYKLELFSGGYRVLKIYLTSAGEKPQSIACNKEGLLFVATNRARLLVLQQNRSLVSISGNNLSRNVQCMETYGHNVLIGSKEGIDIIEFNTTGNKLVYKGRTITKSDGLPSNVVNDLSVSGDTVFAATENGIASFPINFKFETNEITPSLVAIRVNNQNRNITDLYKLGSSERNLAMTFSGADITGHFKRFLYVLNDSTEWKAMTGNTLNAELSSGKTVVLVKAVDVNEQPSGKSLRLTFMVAKPFYISTWFWAIMFVIVSGFVFAMYNRRKFAIQERNYQQQLALEKQRLKITADLHDDIGASLSSLQVNSAIAGELIRRNPDTAKKVLEKIENQSKNLSERIGDFIWSMKPGKDEFMTMSSRIITYVNDILGATNIQYQIDVNKELDAIITDFSTRKNMVLIAKEAVNNAAKYSQASHLSVALKRQGKNAILKVEDNGKGFIPAETKGNGLANMKKRATEIGGTFEIITSPGKGTAIITSFPLP